MVVIYCYLERDNDKVLKHLLMVESCELERQNLKSEQVKSGL